MDIGSAQRDINRAYVAGAPAVLVSGLVWITAGVFLANSGTATGFAALFIGGIFIVPLALAIAKLGFRAAPVMRGNPLDRLGLESTAMLFAGIFIAYALLRAAPALVFPVMAIAIGARYFVFRTIYDEPVYWLLGGLLAALGIAAMLGLAIPGNIALVAGAVELVFAIVLLARWRRRSTGV
jgi:hypothetical protein